MVTGDEGGCKNNRMVAVAAGPAATGDYTSTARYGHYSLLHMIEDTWGLPPLTGNDRDAPVMGDLLK